MDIQAALWARAEIATQGTTKGLPCRFEAEKSSSSCRPGRLRRPRRQRRVTPARLTAARPGRVLTFEIHDGAVGAFFEDEPAEHFDRREQSPGDGLSSVSARPAPRQTFGGAEALHGAAATVRDVMTSSVVSVTPQDSVDEAARLLTFHDISGLPVCDANRVVGVLSEADLIGKSGATVGDVMTSPAMTVVESTSLESVADLLTRERIRRLPVVGSNGQLVGVVSRRDVLRWAAVACR